MEYSNVFVMGDNQANEEKPPPRVCPRCNSNNTNFCYYNNYSVSQPRYICKNCRRYWTHGGTQRNIPIGGRGRKTKRPKINQPSVSQVVSVEIQQVSHHQPFLHVQETNEFVGTFGGSSSSASTVVAGRNHFSSFPEIHGDMVLPIRSFSPIASFREIHGDMVLPIQSFSPIDRLDFSDGSFHQDYYDVGSNDLMGNPLTNQPTGGHVNNYNSYRINQEDQNKQNHSFNNTMNMNHHNASTSGTGGSSSTDHMNNNNNKINKCVPRSSYRMEKHGP